MASGVSSYRGLETTSNDHLDFDVDFVGRCKGDLLLGGACIDKSLAGFSFYELGVLDNQHDAFKAKHSMLPREAMIKHFLCFVDADFIRYFSSVFVRRNSHIFPSIIRRTQTWEPALDDPPMPVHPPLAIRRKDTVLNVSNDEQVMTVMDKIEVATATVIAIAIDNIAMNVQDTDKHVFKSLRFVL